MGAAEHYALKLLTQREHSAFELRRKLERKGYTDFEINPLLHKLSSEGWQDDVRFANAYIRSRQHRGYGPLRVVKELNERGIAEKIINDLVDEQDCQWIEVLAKICNKKFDGSFATDFLVRAKQFRYLQYKGFTEWHIRKYLKEFKS